MTARPVVVSIVAITMTALSLAPLWAQTPEPSEPAPASAPPVVGDDDGQSDAASIPGRVLPDTERLRIKLSMMAAYVHDPSIATLGFETQARLGFVIVDLSGRLTDSFRYHVEINPVDETEPLPACGEEHFFYPNDPSHVVIGPLVQCEPDGRVRVDDYRFIALDPVLQQGPIRQAYLEYNSGGLIGGKFGRFLLPIGLSWEETGAFTAKDAPHISRINTSAAFGLIVNASKRDTDGRRVAGVDVAAFWGDGNRFRDYNYFYWQDGSLGSNPALSALLSGTFSPVSPIEIRVAQQFAYTGSRVERLPNFYATKRNDRATVVSVRYTPNQYVSVFGEYARYVWGITRSSAEILDLEPSPVIKPGYFVGGIASYPIRPDTRIGFSVIREDLSRDDSLVKYLAERDLFRSELGQNERAWILRVFVDLSDIVSVGFFRNNHSNPFRQLSGIMPVSGDRAYTSGRGEGKYGVAVRFRLQ